MKDPISSIYHQFFLRVKDAVPAKRFNDERKVRHIIYTQACTIFGALIFIPLHLLLFKTYAAGIIDIIFLILCLITLADFWFRKNLHQMVWLTAIIPSALAISLFWVMKGGHQVSNYLIIPPGFAFLLLGRREGLIFCGGYILAIAGLIIAYFKSWPDIVDGSLSIVNFWGALILAFFWGYSAEQARNESFESIETVADTDSLTSTANRRHFFEVVDRARKEIKYNRRCSAFLMFDIDFFKSINDTYGHDAGDMVLVELVRLIKGLIRPKDLIGRIGGEEFGILLYEISEENAKERAEFIRRQVEQHTFSVLGDTNISITISIGITMFTYDVELTTEQIYKYADEQLYYAKQAGRNRVFMRSLT